MENLRHVVGVVSDGKCVHMNALDCKGFDGQDHKDAAKIHRILVKRYKVLMETTFLGWEDLLSYKIAKDYHQANIAIHNAAATLYSLDEAMKKLKSRGLIVDERVSKK